MSRRNPFDEIEELFERMNRELEQLGDQIGGEFRPDAKVDVIEYADDLVVVADVPGVTADAIDVSLSGRELRIVADGERDHDPAVAAGADESVETDETTADDADEAGETIETDETTEADDTPEARYHRQERRPRSVDRTIRLPVEVSDEQPTATYQNGVLTITLPKAVADDGTEIEVN